MAKDKNLDRDGLDFGNEKIGRLFSALFFPTLICMIFNSVLTLVITITADYIIHTNIRLKEKRC